VFKLLGPFENPIFLQFYILWNKVFITKVYQDLTSAFICTDCPNCPFQETCAKGKETKSIKVSVEIQKRRKVVRELLSTEEGGESTYKEK
jgi:hypothetical protein